MLAPETVRALRELAAAPGPLLVASDLDGTLAPIVPDPASVRVPRETLAVLARLAVVTPVAVVTGRDLETARRLVPVEGVTIMGSHGFESSLEDGVPGVDPMKLAIALETVEAAVEAAVPSPLLHVEHKAVSTAFHYRAAPELEPKLRAALAELPRGVRLREGRMVIEVIPDAEGGKGPALTFLAGRFGARALYAMGDDLTDVEMFGAAASLRERGARVLLAGISGGDETPPGIIAAADLMLASTDEGREALEVLAEALGA